MRKNTTILLTVLLLLASACGGSDDPATTDDTTPATETPSVDETAAPDDAADADQGDGDTAADGDDGGATGGGDDLAGFFSSNNCLELAMAFSQAASMGMAGTGGSPEEAADTLQRLADEAPPEVSDALETMAAAFAEFARVLNDSGVDLADPSTMTDPAVQQALTEAAEAFDTATIEAAGETVTGYFEDHCSGRR